MTVTPLGRDQDCSLKNREPDVPAPWFLDPGGWSKTAVSLYFIFPGICTLSLQNTELGRSLQSFNTLSLKVMVKSDENYFCIDPSQLLSSLGTPHKPQVVSSAMCPAAASDPSSKSSHQDTEELGQ
ncbi:hypothetical protein STEG23_003799, partial [Scotinomys teguina]